MNKRNYQKEMEAVIAAEKKSRSRADAAGAYGADPAADGVAENAAAAEVPSLLLHACCAPCSSASVERVAGDFNVTVFFYNPNIMEAEEYYKRVEEEKRLLSSMPLPRPVAFLEGKYDPENYLEAVKGLEQEPEGGKRCMVCFRMRLEEAARAAKEGGFDYLTTTLTISPLKSADALNSIGEAVCRKYGVKWLPTDFKKKNGYKRSIELSHEYGLYRQDFCGCNFSRNQAERERAEREQAAETTL